MRRNGEETGASGNAMSPPATIYRSSAYVAPSPFLPQHRPQPPSAGVVRVDALVDVLPAGASGDDGAASPALGGAPRSPGASGLPWMRLWLLGVVRRGSGADGFIVAVPGLALLKKTGHGRRKQNQRFRSKLYRRNSPYMALLASTN